MADNEVDILSYAREELDNEMKAVFENESQDFPDEERFDSFEPPMPTQTQQLQQITSSIQEKALAAQRMDLNSAALHSNANAIRTLEQTYTQIHASQGGNGTGTGTVVAIGNPANLIRGIVMDYVIDPSEMIMDPEGNIKLGGYITVQSVLTREKVHVLPRCYASDGTTMYKTTWLQRQKDDTVAIVDPHVDFRGFKVIAYDDVANNITFGHGEVSITLTPNLNFYGSQLAIARGKITCKKAVPTAVPTPVAAAPASKTTFIPPPRTFASAASIVPVQKGPSPTPTATPTVTASASASASKEKEELLAKLARTEKLLAASQAEFTKLKHIQDSTVLDNTNTAMENTQLKTELETAKEKIAEVEAEVVKQKKKVKKVKKSMKEPSSQASQESYLPRSFYNTIRFLLDHLGKDELRTVVANAKDLLASMNNKEDEEAKEEQAQEQMEEEKQPVEEEPQPQPSPVKKQKTEAQATKEKKAKAKASAALEDEQQAVARNGFSPVPAPPVPKANLPKVSLLFAKQMARPTPTFIQPVQQPVKPQPVKPFLKPVQQSVASAGSKRKIVTKEEESEEET